LAESRFAVRCYRIMRQRLLWCAVGDGLSVDGFSAGITLSCGTQLSHDECTGLFRVTDSRGSADSFV